jgi:DNA (cytosine-5)-methyltransferase 1
LIPAQRGSGLRTSDRDSTSWATPTTWKENGGVSGLVNASSEQMGISGRTRKSRSTSNELADSEFGRCKEPKISVRQSRQNEASIVKRRGTYWDACDWLPCTDGKARPVEPGTFPLVTGAPNRVGRLRGYGNALCAEQAKAFIESYMEIE